MDSGAFAWDASRVELGQIGPDLASERLWPKGEPTWAVSSWSRLACALQSLNEDREVWTDWYEARLRGDPPDEAVEIARARVSEPAFGRGAREANQLLGRN